jgi:glutathione S-transferase
VEVYRIPFSTNVERVALGAGHKGLELEWIDVDPADRSEVERVSGQPLVPVLVDGGRVVVDSTEILRYLEARTPDPPLFPSEPTRRAAVDIFLDWFNRVWKRPPNEIDAERSKEAPDQERIAALGRELTAALGIFENLLAGRDFLFGEFSAADCAAFPFLKYALLYDERDTEEFHLILREFQTLGAEHRNIAAWIRRVDERPRA